MKRISIFLAGFLLGALVASVSLKFYLVRATDGYYVVPKATARWSGSYVDIRKFTLDEWRQRPELALAISQQEGTDLMSEATRQAVRRSAHQAWNQLTAP